MRAGHQKPIRDRFEREALPQLSHLYTAAVYLTRNKTEAEDLVQDTYLRAFRFFAKFQPRTNCRAWLLSILRNLFINRYRKKKREPETVDWTKTDQAYESMVEQKARADPETLLFSKLMDTDLENALKELPEEFRTVIVLVDIEELTYDEAAQVMRCPVGTVRSRVSRGRRMLQVRLKDYAIERGLIEKTPDLMRTWLP